MTSNAELPTRYTPQEMEGEMSRLWEESGLFGPPAEPTGRPSFTIMIPPPNVTGMLHMGHALNNTMQDIVARHKRMSGFETLWVPGTDHAGIATQAVVEKKLFQEEGLTREDVGRDAFLEKIWDWKETYGNTILSQLKRLGTSCDWTRTKFTFDPEMSIAVRTAFVRLWEKDLIYRGARLVNWDCKLQTAVSDDEIEYVERKGSMWFLRYPVAGSEEWVTVGTTRPETMLGDSGVAVHPEDERYRHLVGQSL
ncbi:MAG: class I tRNA ligase family protein, partial [Planctomycetes bacterium]|nr:class I tRNA ligase family protein [Planctomycetota bacterium]